MGRTEKQNRADTIAGSLRGRIFDGKLKAGDRLIEQEIAQEFGMSRGPVREALIALEYEGLVVSEPNKGCMVANLSAEDAYEIFYLRGTLEKMALEKCGGRLLDSSILDMRNLIDDMRREEEDGKNLKRIIEYDERFHEEILRSGKMKRLWQLWKHLSPLNGSMFLKVEQCYDVQEAEAARKFQTSPKKKRKKMWSVHEEMLLVLEKGNLEESLKVIEKHYFDTGEMIYRWELRKDSSF